MMKFPDGSRFPGWFGSGNPIVFWILALYFIEGKNDIFKEPA